MTSTVFERYLDKKIKEDEVAYIALHIGAAVERNRKSIKVIVVCHSGIGTSQFLSARLTNAFKEIEVVSVMSTDEAKNTDTKDVDFIVTTVPFNSVIPSILISPLLNPKDIVRITKMVQRCAKKEKNKSLIPLLDEELIFIKDIDINDEQNGKSTKINAISNMCKELYNKGLVDREFEYDVIKREGLASTYVGKNVCIPHGNPTLVYRTGFAVTYFTRPIYSDEEEISMILLISINSKQIYLSSVLYRNLYRLIENVNF